MPDDDGLPLISVVIPTYNRHELLGRTLETLVDQGVPAAAVEVVVSDDGSGDATFETARSFETRLRMRYVRQPDQGFRVAAARNNGARVARAPVLVFLDTGVLAGPGFVRSHLAAHEDGGASPGRAVMGYTYGYNPFDPYPGLDELLSELPPEEVRRRLADVPAFWDKRHEEFAAVGFDLTRMATAWSLFWTMNVSVRRSDFWAAGGFDEDYRSWGGEDVELGWRLAERGLPLLLSRGAWAVEAPHERDLQANIRSNRKNARLLFDKHPCLVSELFWSAYSRKPVAPFEDEHRAVARWCERARAVDVAEEVARAAGEYGPGHRVAVFGSGSGPFPEGPAWTLVDFDAELLAGAVAPEGTTRLHSLGLHTGLPDRSFDLVLVTSRMAGVRSRWEEDVRAEASRLAPRVRAAPTTAEEAPPEPRP
jgi:glycosyltransferase involved in cell wall biosynthesis